MLRKIRRNLMKLNQKKKITTFSGNMPLCVATSLFISLSFKYFKGILMLVLTKKGVEKVYRQETMKNKMVTKIIKPVYEMMSHINKSRCSSTSGSAFM